MACDERDLYENEAWGICCIIAPNTSGEHKAPKDCYRYFSDGMAGLATWAGLIVLDVTVAGIPERNVSSEWDSHDNDVCLIAKKPCENETEQEYPKLKFERRICGLLDERLRYKFLLKWFGMEKRREFLTQFLKEKDAKIIYVYGNIGKIISRELEQIENIEVEVFDQHMIRTESGKVCKKDNDVISVKGAIMFITVLDSNRDLKLYLDSLYPDVPKFYIDEVFEVAYLKEYFSKHEKVYIYGAGDYGRRVLRFLLGYGFKPEGFVVSKRLGGDSALGNYTIMELDELSINEETGIIVAAGFAIEKEIENNLMEKGINYIMCDVVGVYSSPEMQS